MLLTNVGLVTTQRATDHTVGTFKLSTARGIFSKMIDAFRDNSKLKKNTIENLHRIVISQKILTNLRF